MRKPSSLLNVLPSLVLLLACLTVASAGPAGQSKPTVHQTTLGDVDQKTPEVTTEEVQRILAGKSEPVLDVRSAQEYAIAHIPGSINLYEKEVERITQTFPDKATRMRVRG